MRPLRLVLEGFTSYRRAVEVCFQDMNLFAITGSTGAGKSSLVHAMTYALYGRVPGFGNEVRELISQGSDHLQVVFEFAVGGQRYVVTRRTAHRGASHVRLFRIGEDGAEEGLADRARETEERVQALVGLDFDGFTRSVLLPQGQFHLFLAGEPKERRKVLAELLRLDVYEAIMRAANAEASRDEQDAANLRRRLAEDFADATPAALAERKKRLRGLEGRAAELAASRAALQEGRAATQALTDVRGRLNTVTAELRRDEAALATASELAARGDEDVRFLDQALRKVEEELSASPFDPGQHRRLDLARTPAREHEQAVKRWRLLEAQLSSQEQAVQEAKEQQAEAENAAVKAQEEARQAEAELEGLRREHAAADLRRDLKPGDPCPVCSQPVALLPLTEHVALDQAQARYQRARAAAKAADGTAERARSEAALAQARLDSLGQQVKEAQDDAAHWRQELLAHLGGEEVPPQAQVEAAWRAQEQARQQHQSLEREQADMRRKRDRVRETYEKARGELAGLGARVRAQRSQVERLANEASRAREALRVLARREGWEEVLADLDQREGLTALEGRAAQVEADWLSLQQEIGGVKGDIERIQAGIEQAARLREQEGEITGRARLARELAGLLRADRFQAYVEGEALRVLAEDGSRRLAEVSGGRYEFEVEGQEFLVVDRWNGNATRPVRTLSGGETFLASLALALALAERLPELGALGTGRPLESLFLDEGFSNLDAETRNVVADALERLHLDGTRMVGVITHDRELAERMPSRITLVKSESGSMLSTE